MHLIQEIGSYAGLAAIPGLAILSALYFSQARDVRRLREWAGRAPERAAEIAQGGRVAPRPVTQPAAAQPAAAQPAAQPAAAAATAAAATGASGGGTATAAPPRTAAPAAATTPPGPRRIAPRVPGSGQTSILGPATATPPPSEPWYRRLPAARYIAILLVGIAVVGGGIAYGITQLGSDSGSGGQPAQSPKGGKKDAGAKAAPAPLTPRDVSVSVVNDTTTTGLAASFAGKLSSGGFEIVNKLNGSEQGTVAESVVRFRPGKSNEAKLVAKRLSITQLEPADANTISEGGQAEVIVVLGDDLAGQAP